MASRGSKPVCISCGRGGNVSFACPNPACSAQLVRCGSCKEKENVYKCSACGFAGP